MLRQINAMAKAGAEINPEDFYIKNITRAVKQTDHAPGKLINSEVNIVGILYIRYGLSVIVARILLIYNIFLK